MLLFTEASSLGHALGAAESTGGAAGSDIWLFGGQRSCCSSSRCSPCTTSRGAMVGLAARGDSGCWPPPCSHARKRIVGIGIVGAVGLAVLVAVAAGLRSRV